MTRTVFILRNEELGYVDCCPVYDDRAKAETAAAFKCREHTVMEVPNTYQPCVPMEAGRMCQEDCAIYKFKKQQED